MGDADIDHNSPVVGFAAEPDDGGYYLVAADGGIFAFGDAQFYGLLGGMALNEPIIGMVADLATGGYWLVASDGGIFAYHAPLLFSAPPARCASTGRSSA